MTQSSRADHKSHSGRNRRTPADYFVAGGTLSDDVPSYVERPADDELFQLILSGKFCYVLTARQMGKSSLMIRTARRLQAAGMQTAIIDLTTIGSSSAETWYLDLSVELADELDLAEDAEAWWQARASQGPVRRFSNFLRDVVLAEIQTPVVIFFDEIDSTLGLPFSDDFFTAIRALYNARAKDPTFNRLTFTLIGVASPSDLIMDRTRTPFNIGEGISLNDFGRDRANVLQAGLEAVYPTQGQHIFNRIYDWTGGHPYLTQKLCQEVVRADHDHWTEAQLDALVDQLFLSEQAHREKNLQFVRDKILTHARHRQLLSVYRKIYQGEQVNDDERSIIHNQLKLSGLVKAENGQLQVRNEIYRRVFDGNWIEANTQRDWNRIIAWLAVVMMVLVVALTGAIFWYNSIWVPGLARQATLDFYQAANNPEVQLNSLATLFDLRGLFGTPDYDNDARQLFFGLESAEAQVNLFKVKNPQLISVIKGLSMTLADVDDSHRSDWLLNRMLQALEELQATDEVAQLRSELDHWRQGRQLARVGRFEEALAEYDRANEAIDPSRDNPALRFERIKILIALEDYQQALSDLDQIMAGRSAEPTPTVTSSERTASATTVTVPLTPTTVISVATIVPATPTLASDTSSTPTQAAEDSNPTPSLIPQGIPTPTPTPAPVKLTSEFATTGQIIGVVRQLINGNPGLVEALLNAQSSEYSNLREFGLVPTPAATPTSATVAPPVLTEIAISQAVEATLTADAFINTTEVSTLAATTVGTSAPTFQSTISSAEDSLVEGTLSPEMEATVRASTLNVSQIQADLTALEVIVERLRGGVSDELQKDTAVDIQVNDQISVKEQGRGLLRFPDRLQVELFNGTDVLVRETSVEPGGFISVRLQQLFGHSRTVLNSIADAQVTLETDYATITALDSNTEFLVCHAEALTCLVTVNGEVEVEAQGEVLPVAAGKATYVFPGQPPRPAICANLAEVEQWLNQKRGSEEVEALGELVVAWPQEPCAASTVIYVQSNRATHNLGLVGSDGQLLNAQLHELASAPTWSPDGTEVAFYGEPGISRLGGIYAEGAGIWLLNVQTGAARLLYQVDHVKNMNWSPDGTKLAFEFGPPGVTAQIIVLDAGGGQEISRFPGEQPAWSPDSSRLVIKSCQPECGLWLVGSDGSGGQWVTNNSTDSYPDWSPTGEYLVYTSRGDIGDWEIYRLELATSQIERLTNQPGTDTTPVFSADGLEIYWRTDAHGSWQIRKMALDGSNDRPVIDDLGPSDDWGLARPAVR